MPETINDRQIFSLLEVTKSIQKALAERYKSSFWVKAEMNKLNHYPHSGHCYPELVEKKEGKIIAEIKSILWKDDFQKINNNFLKVLKEPLKNGINILFCARVTYDPVYGLSLRIMDIDPAYSLGELEREKQETIARLKQEAVFNANKMLTIALLPKRIAIISVQTSKGYADFSTIINDNPWGYKYFTMLFPALLQGEKAVESIIGQLRQIKKVMRHFDAVAIIRGGGGDVGLTCYNNYYLSKEIALFPIPVITGIGHATNETVAEMIAFKNGITPTDLADYLIQKFHNYAVPVQKARDSIADKSKRLIAEEQLQLLNTVKYFKLITGSMLIKCDHNIQSESKSLSSHSVYLIRKEKEKRIFIVAQLKSGLRAVFHNQNVRIKQMGFNFKKDTVSILNQDAFIIAQLILKMKMGARRVAAANNRDIDLSAANLINRVKYFITNENLVMNNIEKHIEVISPENVLKRGYSITSINGRVVKQLSDVKEGDILKTAITAGNIISTINQISKTE